MANNAIVFDDGEGEGRSWCNSPCDALLYERKDGSMICSYCGREYLPDSVKKHKMGLQPSKNPYDNTGPELIPLTGYGRPNKKKPQITEYEDIYFVSRKSGMSITKSEEWLPAEERRP